MLPSWFSDDTTSLPQCCRELDEIVAAAKAAAGKGAVAGVRPSLLPAPPVQ